MVARPSRITRSARRPSSRRAWGGPREPSANRAGQTDPAITGSTKHLTIPAPTRRRGETGDAARRCSEFDQRTRRHRARCAGLARPWSLRRCSARSACTGRCRGRSQRTSRHRRSAQQRVVRNASTTVFELAGITLVRRQVLLRRQRAAASPVAVDGPPVGLPGGAPTIHHEIPTVTVARLTATWQGSRPVTTNACS